MEPITPLSPLEIKRKRRRVLFAIYIATVTTAGYLTFILLMVVPRLISAASNSAVLFGMVLVFASPFIGLGLFRVIFNLFAPKR